MQAAVEILVFLMAVIAGAAVVALRLKLPPSIILVLTGVVIALIPGLPVVVLDPQLVLLLVLPPVIYSSAVAMSWREFRFNLRPISLLAVGCVVFTTVAVAALAHFALGLSWPVGFVLGAIVSPPDAVAPLSIVRRLQAPKRMMTILEGEGLANDATALVLYRFAVAAVSAGVFSLRDATGAFGMIVAGELAWGVAAGWAMLRLRRWVGDPRIEILLSILTPFVAYLPPEQLGGSGVLATVTAGLYISWNGYRLISAETRLQGIFFWDFFIFVIEGLVFLLTGLQARMLLSDIAAYRWQELLWSALLVCGAVIVTRFIWMYPATYLPRWLVPSIRRTDPSPPWQWPFALSFTGVRGIVSLAAALAIPLTMENGAPFPDRALILFLTFSVILVTLVGQGLALPSVLRLLDLVNYGRRERRADHREELAARHRAIAATIARLERLADERKLPEETVKPIRAHHKGRLRQISHRVDGDAEHEKLIRLNDEIELELVAAEREMINELYRKGELKDEARRNIERELDLREARMSGLDAD